MTDVEAGGATVFPRIDIRVLPCRECNIHDKILFLIKEKKRASSLKNMPFFITRAFVSIP
jgi:hypothetical protein